MGDLAHDTAVEGDAGRYRGCLSPDWEIWGPNGGYVASVALRAAGAHSRFDRPASIVGHYLGVAEFDEVDVGVETLRAAKRAESLRVSLRQHGQPVFEGLVWAVGDVDGYDHDTTTLPEPGDPESVPSTAERLAAAGRPMWYPFWQNFDQRVLDWVEHDDWEQRPPGDPVYGCWYRYVPASTFADLWIDACRSLILLDTLVWPAAANLHRGPYIAPSIDIAAGFHRFRPDEPWLYAQATATSAGGGVIGGDARVWARDGTLLAVGSSQLLCRPAPPPP